MLPRALLTHIPHPNPHTSPSAAQLILHPYASGVHTLSGSDAGKLVPPASEGNKKTTGAHPPTLTPHPSPSTPHDAGVQAVSDSDSVRLAPPASGGNATTSGAATSGAAEAGFEVALQGYRVCIPPSGVSVQGVGCRVQSVPRICPP